MQIRPRSKGKEGKSMSLAESQSPSLEGRRLTAAITNEHLTPFPRIWYHRTLKPSLIKQSGVHHPHRSRSFSPFKVLATSSRQSLKSPPRARQIFSSTSGNGALSPKHMSLTDLQRSPTPDCRPPGTYPALSRYPSLASLTPDHSAFSNTSSQPATPSPGRQLSYYLPAESELYPHGKMGQKGSTLVKNPISARQSHSRAVNLPPPASPGVSTNSLDDRASDKTVPPILHHRESISQVSVPRRRSSLTALHLDSSHFENSMSPHPELQHRGSTVSEIVRPLARSPSTITAPAIRSSRRKTLSPPRLSPRPSHARLSSPPSLAPSHSSQGPSHIHLPRTFPDGPIVTPAPPLNVIHYKCYQAHRHMLLSKNKIYPVPCMTCFSIETQDCWKCTWCALRICGKCMAELDVKKRDLEALMTMRKVSENVELRDHEAFQEDNRESPNGLSVSQTSDSPTRIDARMMPKEEE